MSGPPEKAGLPAALASYPWVWVLWVNKRFKKLTTQKIYVFSILSWFFVWGNGPSRPRAGIYKKYHGHETYGLKEFLQQGELRAVVPKIR